MGPNPSHSMSQSSEMIALLVISILLNIYFIVRYFMSNKKRFRDSIKRKMSSRKNSKNDQHSESPTGRENIDSTPDQTSNIDQNEPELVDVHVDDIKQESSFTEETIGNNAKSMPI